MTRSPRVNLAGFFHITQLAIRQMVTQGGGHVVNITASLVDDPSSDSPSALASLTKGGLAAVTRSLATEYASRAVRVNAVAPGSHQDSRARRGLLRGHGRLPRWPDRRDQRRRRRDPVSRTGNVRHRRDAARRRRSSRGTLRCRARPATSVEGSAGRCRRRCGPQRACRSDPERRRRPRPPAAAPSCPTARRCTPARTRARRR